MSEFLTNFFSSQAFIPHGHCYLWKTGLVWLHLASDAFIALAYYSIPITLFYFVRKRHDLPFYWIFLLFAAFIIACGTTHIMSIWTLWHPTYWLSGSIKAITAIVSVLTAVELVPLVPKALALPSPSQLQQANQELQAQITERLRVENELQKYQVDLEELVAVRTNELTQEIAERELALKALQDSEERLKMATTAAGLGMWFWDLKIDEVVFTEQFLVLFGLEENKVMSYNSFLNYVHPDDRHCIDEAVSFAINNKNVNYYVEYRCIWPNGNVRWIAAKGQLFFDTNGEAVKMMGTVQDITERKQGEEALRQSEERYRYLAEAIPQLVWTTDANGMCDYVNQRLREYTGIIREEVSNLGWTQAIHPDDLERSYEIWMNAVNSGILYEDEYRFRRGLDGQYRWHLVRGLPLYNEQGFIIKWFGTCTDIHEQKQIESERARLLELERVARAKAEEVNRIKDEFLAVLSHELRTPLNPILGWTKILRKRNVTPAKTAEALETIERNATLQLRLIEDLLDISRVVRGQLSLNVAPVNLELVVKEALSAIKLSADAKLISVITNLSANVGEVEGDAVRLQQVVWNLLSNAVKFTPQKGRIEVLLEQVDGFALIKVSDSGKGIAADFLPYVFDRFSQADSSISRKFGGLGLGLAIARHLVELHGGTIKAQSPGEEQGAVFTIRLPLLRNGKS